MATLATAPIETFVKRTRHVLAGSGAGGILVRRSGERVANVRDLRIGA
jgi:hypothetical protein